MEAVDRLDAAQRKEKRSIFLQLLEPLIRIKVKAGGEGDGRLQVLEGTVPTSLTFYR
jgi:hypothetical protein